MLEGEVSAPSHCAMLKMQVRKKGKSKKRLTVQKWKLQEDSAGGQSPYVCTMLISNAN